MITLHEIPDPMTLTKFTLSEGINVAVKSTTDRVCLWEAVRDYYCRILFTNGVSRTLYGIGSSGSSIVTGYDQHEVRKLGGLGYNCIAFFEGKEACLFGSSFVDQGMIIPVSTRQKSEFRNYIENRIFGASQAVKPLATPLPNQTGPQSVSKGSPAASVQKSEILPIHRAMAATRRPIGIYDGLLK